jgi:hypothetical protein
MPSTFSPALRIELIGSGEQSGVWGNTTNNNLGDLVEQAITGSTEINVTAADVTLTALNGVVDQARSAVLIVTGTAGVTRVITIPNANKTYTVKNRSDATVQIKTASGTAFDVPTLSEAYVYCDGANVITGRVITDGANAITSLTAPFASPAFTGTPTAPTASLGTNTTQIATTAFVNAEIASDTANLAPLNSPALTGVPTAPTASVGTNTTQLATTAFVNAEIANDAPTKTGTGASGTWGINITGNAATATSATSATNATNVTGTTTASIITSALGSGTANSTTFLRGDRTFATLTIPADPIPAGSVMLFVQTAAPTGWTKSTTHDNKALRVVSGTASSGGSVAFTTAFASKAVSGSIANATATNQDATATNIAVTATNIAVTAGGTVANHTLTVAQLASHGHSLSFNFRASPGGFSAAGADYELATGGDFVVANNNGSNSAHSHGFTGTSHNHTQDAHNHTQNAHTHTQNAHNHTFTGTAIDLAVQYVDVIICTKN